MNLANYLNRTNLTLKNNNTVIAKNRIGYSILRELIFYYKMNILLEDGLCAELIPSNTTKITLKKSLFNKKSTFYIPKKFQEQILVYPITVDNYNFIKEKFKKLNIPNINIEYINEICLNLSLIDFGFNTYNAYVDKSFIKSLYNEEDIEYLEIDFKTINFDTFINFYFDELMSIYEQL